MLLQTAVQFLRALRIQATPHEAVHGIPTDRLAFSKTWSADVDIALLAVSEVFSRPKNRVCQYTRRIVAKASSIGFNGCLQRGAFVERIPSQILYAEIAVDNAHFNLGAKLDRGSLLSPYDWSHPRLAQTDNALVDVFLFRTFLSFQDLSCLSENFPKSAMNMQVNDFFAK